jgi:hypothetical protein
LWSLQVDTTLKAHPTVRLVPQHRFVPAVKLKNKGAELVSRVCFAGDHEYLILGASRGRIPPIKSKLTDINSLIEGDIFIWNRGSGGLRHRFSAPSSSDVACISHNPEVSPGHFTFAAGFRNGVVRIYESKPRFSPGKQRSIGLGNSDVSPTSPTGPQETLEERIRAPSAVTRSVSNR